MKPAGRNLDPSALELVEEAVHLLRSAPAGALAVYYAGAVPFVLGLLFFGAYTSWFHPPGGEMAWSALGLVVLFVVMKAAQAEFCARLLALRLGEAPPPWSWARFRRLMIAQIRLQPWALLATIIAALIAIPFGWVYAYGQSATVVGDDEQLHQAAVAHAKLWPRENHTGLLLLSLLALCAWFNLAVTFFTLPWLANRLLGIENIFGFSGWWFVNTTFLASVTGLAWLAVDPLVKAFYTLRVFHGRARSTGEDIRVELRLARRGSLALVALLLLAPSFRLRAAVELAAPPASVQPAQLDRAIDGVLTGPDFRWRLHPLPAETESKDGPIKRFVRSVVESILDVVHAIGHWLGQIVDWFIRNLLGNDGRMTPAAGAGSAARVLLRLVVYLFIAAAVLLILWLIYLVVKQTRRNPATVLVAQSVPADAPDLRNENVEAARLPADGWLALAREQMGRGEWRLALRALYLATLARLAADGLISLAKFKTNLDYERELRRRALSRAEIVAHFATRRRAFEDVWYGRAQPGESDVRAWLTDLERAPTP